MLRNQGDYEVRTMQRFLKTTFLILAGLAALSALPRSAGAAGGVASAYYDNYKDFVLSDGTKVRCLRSLGSSSGKQEYYYVPTNLHIAKTADGTPKFLFLKFTTEKREDKGGVQGALMHFLTEFGLSAAQMNELNGKLQSVQKNAVCVGCVPVTADGETSTFQVTSATLTDQGLTKSLITSGKAPLMPGSQAACAARLTGNGAQLLAATFEKNTAITDVSLSYNLAYTTLVPGVDAYMRFYGEKLKREFDSVKVDYHNTHETTGRFLGFLWETSGEDTISYKEAQSQWQYMLDKGYVVCNIKQRVDNDLTNKITQSFMQMFLDAMTQKAQGSPEDILKDRQGDKDKDKNTDPQAPAVSGNHYSMSKYKWISQTSITDRTWNFTAQVPITQTIQLTGNLKDWYNGVKDNPQCVAAVNLNDPFFSHRDVRFILDLDAKEMFDEAVNYVTVNVRKKRSSGRDFEDHLTIDAKFLKENGVNYGMTYARGDDTNPDAYQYQTQWSLRGGNVYPENPKWETGSWEGVTLKPPVKPLSIDFEASLDDLKAKDITRVTAQIHYYQFGKEAETNIQISPAKGAPLVSQKIFMDRDKKAYAYRLVFNHKTMGKLAGKWVGNISDGYIYASIPENVATDNSFQEQGKNALNGIIEKILDKFNK